MSASRPPFALLVAALLSAAVGCSFDPKIPNGRLFCTSNDQCPRDFVCTEIASSLYRDKVKVCCRDEGCDGLSEGDKTQIIGAGLDAGIGLDGPSSPTDASDGPAPATDGCLCGEPPLPACPASCPMEPGTCKLGRVDQPGTCRARCVYDTGLSQTACVPGDGCCPQGCDAARDSDCSASCGNGTVEPPAEHCDPMDTCPTACAPAGCTQRRLEGTKDTCTARCVEGEQQTMCMSGDMCCPKDCTVANDDDCRCVCGDGKQEEACGETCDPKESCPTTCPQQGCMLQRLLNAGTCQAVCVPDKLQTQCVADGCCPPNCNATNDPDCTPRCDNGVKEAGELCDPVSSCPMVCPWMGCARRRLEGDANQCKAQCVDDGTQMACASNDGCCPSGCNSTNDNDCSARCGNGVREGNETCDGQDCPASCPAMGCQRRKLQGTAAACTAECVNDVVIGTCVNGDGCCAQSCTSVNDNDCNCQCGNGATEPACNEKCDGANCPNICPPMGCQKRRLQGTPGMCTAECVNDVVETGCKPGDGCCAPGCNANNDNDCTAACGNGAVESGETCDPPSACQAQSDACTDDANNVRKRNGVVASCTFTCTSTARTCGNLTDGFCPTACTPCGATCAAGQDIDCKLPNGTACTHANQCAVTCLDGRCCGTATCPTCQSCTGSGGACANIGAGVEDTVPAGACTGTSSCNGAGACRLDNGQSCTTNAQCAFGACVDGVCCENTCTTVCRSCAIAGMLGLCRPIASGPDSAGPALCVATQTCVSGVCKKVDGQPCGAAAECASGACTSFFVDGDADGFGAGAAVLRCGTTPPSGHAAQAGDCCDTDNRARPGQLGHFGSQRIGCGGFDFDCVGGATKQPASSATYSCMPCRGGFDPGEYAGAVCGQVLEDHGCMPLGVGGLCGHPVLGTDNVACK